VQATNYDIVVSGRALMFDLFCVLLVTLFPMRNGGVEKLKVVAPNAAMSYPRALRILDMQS